MVKFSVAPQAAEDVQSKSVLTKVTPSVHARITAEAKRRSCTIDFLLGEMVKYCLPQLEEEDWPEVEDTNDEDE